jgi:hypothetical protein
VACDPELTCLNHLQAKEAKDVKAKRLQPIIGAANIALNP